MGHVFIRTAEANDLPAIAALERIVEDPRFAASPQVLHDRLRLYPQGFLVAVFNEQVVGYLESIRWDYPAFERFEQIKDFEHIHRPGASVLYIAFAAVDPAYRRYGTALKLLKAAERMAARIGVSKIQLVAMPNLVRVYRIMGFREVRTLPFYLESSIGELMEKTLSSLESDLTEPRP
jgi:ribosomal protein S18 acetylase RimI-like enzyme